MKDNNTGIQRSPDYRYPLRTDWAQNGFENRTDSTTGFVNGTRTFTITPAGTSGFTYFVDGIKYVKYVAEDIIITDVEGIHVIYYDGSTLSETVNPTSGQVDTILRTKTIIAYFYWDVSAAEQIYFGEERHGAGMSPSTHAYLHFTQGLAYLSGLGLSSMVVDGDGSSNTHAQFATDAGDVTDEDLYLAVSTVLSTVGLPNYYMLGASAEWQKDVNTGFSIRTFDDTSATRLCYNEYTGGAWQLTQVGSGDYVLCHIFASTEKDYPMMSVMGQATYTTKKAARAGALTEITELITNDILFPEIRAIATVIFETNLAYTNDVNARVLSTEEGDDYIDWRSQTIERTEISTTDHGSLNGLLHDDHIGYFLLAGRATGQVLIGGTAANDDITFQTTSDGTKGSYIFSELNVAGGIVQTDGSGVFSTSVTLPDGTLATTQGALDSSTKLATTAYTDSAVGAVIGTFTDGSVLYAASGAIAEDNSHLYYDPVNYSLNVGGIHPTEHVNGVAVSARIVAKTDDGQTLAANIVLTRNENTSAATGGVLYGARSRGTLAASTVVQDGDRLLSVLALGYDGTDYAISSQIDFEVDGIPGNDDMPGRILFKVAADGTQSPTERMRIATDYIYFKQDVKSDYSPAASDTNTFFGIGTNPSALPSGAAENTCIGYNAGSLLDTSASDRNTLIGASAGKNIQGGTGSYNTCIGANAGDIIAGGDSNICIGYDVDPAGGALAAYEINIGNTIYGHTGSDLFGIGSMPTNTYLLTKAGGTIFSSLQIPHGVAPTAPTNGDVWSTTANFFLRVNGATQTVVYAGGAYHDGFSDFVANEHIDWTSTAENFNTSGTITGGIAADDATYTGIVTVDTGVLKYRTKAEVLSDIGAQATTLEDSPGSDHTVSSPGKVEMTVGENVVFGDVLYMKSDGKLWKSDADAAATMPVIAMAIATILADAAGEVMIGFGFARDDTWAWTVGTEVYASLTAGELTQTAPSATGDQVQIVGMATHADRILFNPNSAMVEIV